MKPLSLVFRLHRKVNLSAYYMLRSVRGVEEWSHAHILGASLALAL